MRPSAPTQDANNRTIYIVDQVPLSSLVFQNLYYKKPPCQTFCIVRVHACPYRSGKCWRYQSFLYTFLLAHVLFSALVGVFGGFLGCRLYRLGVFTIGECLGLVSSTKVLFLKSREPKKKNWYSNSLVSLGSMTNSTVSPYNVIKRSFVCKMHISLLKK